MAVCECDGNKRLGSNGFNFNFIKQDWDIVKEDVMRVVRTFTVLLIGLRI